MSSRDPFLESGGNNYGTSQSAYEPDRSGWSKKQSRLSLVTIGVLVAAVIGLAIALAVTKSSKSDEPEPIVAPGLEGMVHIDDLMRHINQLQIIADQNNGMRYVGTPGFNATVDYVESQLRKTNFNIFKQFWNIQDWNLTSTPTMQVVVDTPTFKRASNRLSDTLTDQQTFNYVYGQDFTVLSYSGSASIVNLQLYFVPNGGCSAADFAGIGEKVGVVQYNASCSTITQRITWANAARAAGLMLYAGPAGGGQLINTRAPDTNTLPVVFMTYATGAPLALMAQADTSASKVFAVSLTIQQERPSIVLTNICADTKSGDPTSTIIIGSHTDSVKFSGINDNGSGVSSNLVWALATDKLLSTTSTRFNSRLRFCFWAGEELGLLGSKYYVAQAALRNSTEIGERLIDIQLNFNYDMTASPNYLYGVLDAFNTNGVNATAVPGSQFLTSMFNWYLGNASLPITSKEFNGRSDYGSFLAVGIPAGGISAFIDRQKTIAEVAYYTSILGVGKGGIANVATDPCYHQECDRISNINPDVFIGITRAQANVMEKVAKMDPKDLRKKMGRPDLTLSSRQHHPQVLMQTFAEIWE